MINTLGYNLRMLRFTRNYTQKYVAAMTDLPPSLISKFENNYVKPDGESIQKLAEFYEITVGEITMGEK